MTLDIFINLLELTKPGYLHIINTYTNNLFNLRNTYYFFGKTHIFSQQFFKVNFSPNMGLVLTTPRWRIECSTDRASQVSHLTLIFKKELFYSRIMSFMTFLGEVTKNSET